MTTRYKIEVRNCPNWRKQRATTLGVSIMSPNWQGEKFQAIMEFASENFEEIRIDVTDALYRHNFMAQGLDEEQAFAQATAAGSLWLTQHADIIMASPVKPQIIRWARWYKHADFEAVHHKFVSLYNSSSVFHDAVESDIMNFYRRANNRCHESERQHSRDFLIEEVAVITLQARELPSVKIYPGEELNCLNVVRRGLVEDAPTGLEREQYAKIKFETRPAYKKSLSVYGTQKLAVASLL